MSDENEAPPKVRLLIAQKLADQLQEIMVMLVDVMLIYNMSVIANSAPVKMSAPPNMAMVGLLVLLKDINMREDFETELNVLLEKYTKIPVQKINKGD